MFPMIPPTPVRTAANTVTIEGVQTPTTGRFVAQLGVVSSGGTAGLLEQRESNNLSETLAASAWVAPNSGAFLAVRAGTGSPLYSRWNTVSFTGAKISSHQAEDSWDQVPTAANWGYDLTGFVRDSTVTIDFALQGNTSNVIDTVTIRFWVHAV